MNNEKALSSGLCKQPTHSQSKGNQVNGSLYLRVCCKDCGNEIKLFKNIRKSFCDDCLKKHKYKRVKQWKKNNPMKVKVYEWRRRIKKTIKRGGTPRLDILNCLDCGKDITNRFGNAIYCVDCVKKHKKERDYIRVRTEEYKNKSRYYDNFRRKSTGLGPHRNIDFDKEFEIVRNAKNAILRYGNRVGPFLDNFNNRCK